MHRLHCGQLTHGHSIKSIDEVNQGCIAEQNLSMTRDINSKHSCYLNAKNVTSTDHLLCKPGFVINVITTLSMPCAEHVTEIFTSHAQVHDRFPEVYIIRHKLYDHGIHGTPAVNAHPNSIENSWNFKSPYHQLLSISRFHIWSLIKDKKKLPQRNSRDISRL